MTKTARAHSHDAPDARDDQHLNVSDDTHRHVRRRTIATTITRPRAIVGPEQIVSRADAQVHAQPQPHPHPHPHPKSRSQPLDLKALRLAVHGWWLGNPLIYKPGVADLTTVARELACAGAASGTLVLSDMPAGSGRPTGDGMGALSDAKAAPYDTVHAVHAVLILRPPTPLPRTPLGAAAARAIAEVAQATLGQPCSVRWRWQVVLRDGGRIASRLGRVRVEQDEDVALADMRFALDALQQAAQDTAGRGSAALFARSDWREVFLARVLHALDGHLREP